MWCIGFIDKNNELLHMICTKDKPSEEELERLKQEVTTDLEFNHITKRIDSVRVAEVNEDYDEFVRKIKEENNG